MNVYFRSGERVLRFDMPDEGSIEENQVNANLEAQRLGIEITSPFLAVVNQVSTQ